MLSWVTMTWLEDNISLVDTTVSAEYPNKLKPLNQDSIMYIPLNTFYVRVEQIVN